MKLEVDTVDIEGVKTLIEPEENSLETIKRFSAILDELLRDKSFSGTGKIFINKIKNAPPFLGLENSILDLKTEMQFVEYFLAKKFKEDRGKYIRGGGSLTVTKTDNSIEDISKRIYGSKSVCQYSAFNGYFYFDRRIAM